MKKKFGLSGIIFAIFVQAQAMLELPLDLQKVIIDDLDIKSFVNFSQVSTQTKSICDDISSTTFEERGITLPDAFKKKNAYLLTHYIKDKNYQELIDNPSLGRAIMLWAAYNGHRAIFDGLYTDKRVTDAMSDRISLEYCILAYLCAYRDYYTELAKADSSIDPDAAFASKGLVLAVKNGITSIVQKLIHTPSYSENIKPKSINKALVIAAQNGYYKIVRILLSNQRVFRLVSQESVRNALIFACENNDKEIVGDLLNNYHVIDALSVSWLRKMSNKFTANWMRSLFYECVRQKRESYENN